MGYRAVGDILERRWPVAVEPTDSVRQAALAMARQRCGSVVVTEGNNLRGIFTERDLLVRVVAAGLDLDRTSVGEVMTRDPDTIEAKASVCDAIRRMDEFGYRHLPVVDNGRLLGVVSIRDMPMCDRAQMEPELEERHALAERMW